MTQEEFISRISNITTASGPRASYKKIHVRYGSVYFTRDSTGNQESVSISQLYELYRNEEFINTNIAREYITGRVYSPSVAILKSAGLVGLDGRRLQFQPGEGTQQVRHGERIVHKFSSKPKPEPKESSKPKDETLFFKALNAFIGPNHLYSKSVGYTIDSSDVFLSDNYNSYRFTKEPTKLAFRKIMSALNGTENFNSNSLSHHVDGLIHDHKLYGNRIVEFDEEQHFTPARKDTLIILSKTMDIPYAERFIEICNDLDYLNDSVLKKHRIKQQFESVPDSFIDFTQWLYDANVSESGYIAPKKSFNYKGGRIAQRAYYDSLRDVAHLSEFNKRHKLKPPLRFAKHTFETKYNKVFSALTQDEIIAGIKEILKKDFNL